MPNTWDSELSSCNDCGVSMYFSATRSFANGTRISSGRMFCFKEACTDLEGHIFWGFERATGKMGPLTWSSKGFYILESNGPPTLVSTPGVKVVQPTVLENSVVEVSAVVSFTFSALIQLFEGDVRIGHTGYRKCDLLWSNARERSRNLKVFLGSGIDTW